MGTKAESSGTRGETRRGFLKKLGIGAIGAAAIAGPLRAANAEPRAELAPEADPGEDSIFRPAKPRS